MLLLLHIISLVPRPPALIAYSMQKKMEGEGLGNLTTCSTARLTSRILDAMVYSHSYQQQ